MSFDIIIDWEEYKTDFRGHEVTMQLRPLKRWASVALTPIFKRSREKFIENEKKKRQIEVEKSEGIEPKNEPEKVTEEEINFAYDVQAVAEKVFPDHVKDIVGITVNKLAITIPVLCEESAFGPLCIDIVGELAKRSNLTEQEEKNSNGPSGTPMKTDENTQEN
jgi:hypothetical protein